MRIHVDDNLSQCYEFFMLQQQRKTNYAMRIDTICYDISKHASL